MPKIDRPEPSESLWKPGKVKVHITYEGGGYKLIPTSAKLFAGLAVHECLKEEGQPTNWRITHIPTGMMVARLKTESDAMRAGEEAWNIACMTLRCKTKEEAEEKVPTWVKKWLKEVTLKGEYLPSSNYRKGAK